MMTNVEFITSRYEWAHHRKPRGFRLWYFRMPDGATFCYAGPYFEAKRAAAAHARRRRGEQAVPILVCA
jgi:hypothetical protein